MDNSKTRTSGSKHNEIVRETVTPKTNKVKDQTRTRVQEYRKRKRNDEDYKEKERKRFRAMRKAKKENSTPRSIRRNRLYERNRKREYRKRKRELCNKDTNEVRVLHASGSGNQICSTLTKLKNTLKREKQNKLYWKRIAEKYKKRSYRVKNFGPIICPPQDGLPGNKLNLNPMGPNLPYNRKLNKVLVAQVSILHHVMKNKHARGEIVKCASQIIRKYRMCRFFSTYYRLSSRTVHRTVNRKQKVESKSAIVQKSVHEFYERDDNSRIASGKKLTKTKKQIKKTSVFFSITCVICMLNSVQNRVHQLAYHILRFASCVHFGFHFRGLLIVIYAYVLSVRT